MSKDQLKNLMSRLAEMEAEASINLDEVDPAVRIGAEGLWRQAREQVAGLRKQYLDMVIPYVFIIGVKGPGAEAFAQIAASKFDTVAINYKTLTKQLTTALQNRRCDTIYGQNEHWMLLTELGQIKNKYDIVRMPAPAFSALSSYYQKELFEAIDILLRETYGTTLTSQVLRREIASAALERRFHGTKLPVILYNFDQDLESGLDSSLLPKPVTLLDTNEDVTEESVKSSLLKVRDLVTGGTSKKRTKTKATEELSTETETETSDDTEEKAEGQESSNVGE